MKKRFDEIIGRNGLTLVDFYASWCGPCKALHPILDRLASTLGDRVEIHRYDIDEPDNAEIVARYDIRSVPTLFLFRGGKALWRTSGVVSAEYLKGVVEKFETAYAS